MKLLEPMKYKSLHVYRVENDILYVSHLILVYHRQQRLVYSAAVIHKKTFKFKKMKNKKYPKNQFLFEKGVHLHLRKAKFFLFFYLKTYLCDLS